MGFSPGLAPRRFHLKPLNKSEVSLTAVVRINSCNGKRVTYRYAKASPTYNHPFRAVGKLGHRMLDYRHSVKKSIINTKGRIV